MKKLILKGIVLLVLVFATIMASILIFGRDVNGNFPNEPLWYSVVSIIVIWITYEAFSSYIDDRM